MKSVLKTLEDKKAKTLKKMMKINSKSIEQISAQMEESSVVLYPTFNEKLSQLEVISVSKQKGELKIESYKEQIENAPDFLNFTIRIKELEELLLLENRDKEIVDKIFEINRDNKMLKVEMTYSYFMNNYRYKLFEWIVSYFRNIVIKSIPKGTKKIYFSPLGALTTLPFHVISISEEGYLIDGYEIIYIPSLSIWDRLKQSNQKREISKNNLYISQDRESESACYDEVNACQRYLKGEHKEKIDSVALKKLIHNRSFNTLHLSVHGSADLKNSLNTSLHLYQSRFSLLEVYELQLQANLIFLSACETNLARVEGLDEILAFERAFIIAGAINIITTFNKVNAQRAKMFTTAFYTHLQKYNHHQNTTSYSEAFRQSAIESIDNGNMEWMLFRFMGV